MGFNIFEDETIDRGHLDTMYKNLTRYAGALTGRKTSCAFGAGTLGLEDFKRNFYALEGFADTGYHGTLERHGVTGGEDELTRYDVEHVGVDFIRAAITWCVRGDRFCDGHLSRFAANGFLDRCLERLKELDTA